MGGMFIEVAVVLARAEFSIFLFDEEERGCLVGVQWANFSCNKVFSKEVLSCFLFVEGERVDFAYLRHEGFIHIYFMIIGTGGGNMICGFLGEDLGKVSIF